ncbi:hypothetical protein SLT36_30070 (plasmid) [Aminobacter sp. BA135]|uniref:hypothetical protein n=1 Tax=Aminobacter sp. BA135 TaxID=537596 RepID=UPI003D78FB47
MRAGLPRTGVLSFAVVLMLAGCSTSSEAPVTVDGLRAVAGTSLIGARGREPADQAGIDETVAGFCAAGVWTKSECARHGKESRL